VEEALVPLGFGDGLRSEDVVDVDRRQRQVCRDSGWVEQDDPDCQRRDDEDRERASQAGAPGGSTAGSSGSGWSGFGSGLLPFSTGVAYG
jgi:hypothetical protein